MIELADLVQFTWRFVELLFPDYRSEWEEWRGTHVGIKRRWRLLCNLLQPRSESQVGHLRLLSQWREVPSYNSGISFWN